MDVFTEASSVSSKRTCSNEQLAFVLWRNIFCLHHTHISKMCATLPNILQSVWNSLVLKQGLPKKLCQWRRCVRKKRKWLCLQLPGQKVLREHMYHPLLPINGSVVKELHDYRSICPKFNEGHSFLILFLLPPPQLFPINGLDPEVHGKSNVFSGLLDPVLSLKHFHLIF